MSQGHRCHLKGFYSLTMHAKYEVCISYGAKGMAKVKGFLCIRVAASRTNMTKTKCPRIPFRGHKNNK